ncbi:hypothetical protein AB833_18835 [Chromatiales bacterium (ex Bugula neritina AB1)]|nr:hypothetical protein AB833_18835 [Chromatiales bacterium (ex Bugula neritina AB1)]
MHRDPILQLLKRYGDRYPRERRTVDSFRAFVTDHEDCFERSQLSGHVTGSAWLTDRAGGHVLLTHHKKLNLWLQLGGHADGEADVLQVALREAIEESGIESLKAVGAELFDIDIHSIPARKHEPEHYHYDARFAFRCVETDQFTVSEESHALEWVAINRLKEKTSDESMHRMAEKWLSQAG